jgi:hypothetical protein
VVGVIASLAADGVALLVVAAAFGYVAFRAFRLFRGRGAACGCGTSGKPGCPAASAADELREAARRAALR